jgi:hypothetical protein
VDLTTTSVYGAAALRRVGNVGLHESDSAYAMLVLGTPLALSFPQRRRILMLIVISAAVFALTLWGSIKLLDRYNTRNTLPIAAFVGIVFAAFSPGSIFVLLPLVALLYLLVSYYDIGFFKSFGVVGSMIAMNLGLQELTSRVLATL